MGSSSDFSKVPAGSVQSPPHILLIIARRLFHLRMSSRHLGDSGFAVATLARDAVLAPAKAEVAVLLVFANHGRGHLRGRSHNQVGAGGLRLGGRRACTGNGM